MDIREKIMYIIEIEKVLGRKMEMDEIKRYWTTYEENQRIIKVRYDEILNAYEEGKSDG